MAKQRTRRIIGGPIGVNPRPLQNPDDFMEEDPHTWMPRFALEPVKRTGKPFQAAELKAPTFMPKYFINPHQSIDYLVIEAVTKNTFVGPLMTAFTKFIIGTGFRPELELLYPEEHDNPEKEIEANSHIIKSLKQIDMQLDTGGIPFREMVAAMIDTANIFNRSALIFGYGRSVEIDGVMHRNIPSSLKFAHARDLGMIEVDKKTWNLKNVQWVPTGQRIPRDEMIYLWHPLTTAKWHNAWWYGASMVMPMLDAARVLRKIIAQDFPVMAEATYAGMYILFIKPEGQTDADKEQEFGDVVRRLVRAGPNIMLVNPEETRSDKIDFDPKVDEFRELCEFLIKQSIASLGLPNSMFFDEAASNRSTLIGKIQLAITTVINPIRQSYGEMIANQWYMRWFKMLYPEEAKKFRIRITWDDLNTAQWFDIIEAVNELDARKELKPSAYGKLAHIENYESQTEPNAEVTPGGSSGKSMSWDDGKGNSLEMKQTKSKGTLGDRK